MHNRVVSSKRRGHVLNRRAAIADAILALEPRRLFSTTFTVNTFADQSDAAGSTVVSLRDALALAAATTGGATIDVPGGTYTLSLGQLSIPATSGTVSLQPVSGTPVVNANGASRILNIAADATVSISNFEFENGYISAGPSQNGAGISNSGNLTLTGSSVQASKIAYSGTSASANDEGAGIFNSQTGTLTIVSSLITGNVATAAGGGVNFGGGIYNGGTLIMAETTVSYNSANEGAGLYNAQGAFIQASSIFANTAQAQGGGIENVGTVSMGNTTVADNQAGFAGGGINNAGALTAINSTITGNGVNSSDGSTAATGGGIASGNVTLGNTIVAGNTATSSGAGTPAAVGPDVAAKVTSKGGNLIGVTSGSTGWGSTDLTGTTASPLSAGLGTLGSHGGVPTEIPQAGSAAIDHGVNSLVSGSTDARGLTRIINNTVDIGAVESQPVVTAAAAQTASVGVAKSISLGSFVDTGAIAPYTVTVVWGDGSANTSFTVAGPGSLGTQSHTYAASGTFNGSVTITDGYGESAKAASDPSVTVSAGSTTVNQLTGTVFGTAGSYGNSGNTIAKAVDGNLSTYFDGPTANGNVVGIDLGSAQTITEIKYASRGGWASRMNGGIFEASNSATFATGDVVLYTIPSGANPSSTALTTQNVSVSGTYRYVEYISPAGSFGDIAEFQVFGPGTTGPAITEYTGTVFGTSGSYGNSGNTISHAVDGSLATYFDGPTANGNVVGLNLGKQQTITQIAYASRSGFASRMNGGIFEASNSPTFASGNVILYTIPANANPGSGSLTTQNISVSGTYQYVEYISPAGSYGDISEFQVFGPGTNTTKTKLAGTVFGTAGSYDNGGNTIAKAVDGNTTTFFDGPTANGNIVGLALGSASTISSLSYTARSGFESRMVGGYFQASNSSTFASGNVTLYTITAAPASGSTVTVSTGVTGTYLYVRYVSPAGSYGDIAEMSFFA